MEILLNKAESDDSILIKSLAIVFPEGKIKEYHENESIKILVTKIDGNQFLNLVTLLNMYQKEVDIERATMKISIKITNQHGTED